MKIFIKAYPRAKEERIEKIDETHYSVWVKKPPLKGKANQAIIKVLAEYFKISPSRVKIIAGYASRQKTIEIIRTCLANARQNLDFSLRSKL